MSSGGVLAVDIGGTSIKAEILDAGLRCRAAASAPTPRSDGAATLPPPSISAGGSCPVRTRGRP